MISCDEHPCFEILGDPLFFFRKVKSNLDFFKIDISDKEIDHVCYRVESIESYLSIRDNMSNYGSVLVEGMIGGRPICTFLLHVPIRLRDESNCWEIRCFELPCPKSGNKYLQGFEHIEIVIGTVNSSCVNSRQELKDFTLSFPGVLFETSAIDKEVNADVSMNIDENCSVKFHVKSLYDVIEFEILKNFVIPVPHDYF